MSPSATGKRQEVLGEGAQAIVAHFFSPRPEESRGAVIIVPAMGVSQRYYWPFAEWLSAHGFLVATFDFQGIGLSRTRPLREVSTDIIAWAQVDCARVIESVTAQTRGAPLYWIGHSLGGQILPFVPNRLAISKMITIATGSGYWRETSPSLRRVAWWLWYVVVPVSLRLFGYFPGKRLRKVGDLPHGVMAQWRHWCLDSEYAVGAESESVREMYSAVTTPIVSLSFTDDEYMSARNTESMHCFYTSSRKKMKRISPGDIGVKRIGHFGFFREDFADSLWKNYLLPELSET